MTTYLWDASNYDDPIRVRDGLDGYTHKAGEGHQFYYDREYRASLEAARGLGIPVLGAYFVNHPGSVADQVDWFVSILDQDTSWWRQHPCFILEIDAEKFGYMDRAPTRDEIQAFGDRLVQVHGVDPRRVLAYAPRWLYGDSLTGLTYRLWASDYGGNPVAHYREAYPGDDDVKRWRVYSSQTPLLLQYGSNLTIGDQTTCDANAFRGSLAELLDALGAGRPVSTEEKMITLVPGPNGALWACDGMLARELSQKDVDDLRYIAAQGAVQLWHDPADGSDVWKGGLVPAFGIDVATLTGGGAGGSGPTHAELAQAAFEGAQRAEKE